MCPFCFICHSGSTFDLRLDHCSNAYYSKNKQIGSSSMMIGITVVNTGTATCTVKTTGGTSMTSSHQVVAGKTDNFMCFSTNLNTAITGLTTDYLYLNDR